MDPPSITKSPIHGVLVRRTPEDGRLLRTSEQIEAEQNALFFLLVVTAPG